MFFAAAFTGCTRGLIKALDRLICPPFSSFSSVLSLSCSILSPCVSDDENGDVGGPSGHDIEVGLPTAVPAEAPVDISASALGFPPTEVPDDISANAPGFPPTEATDDISVSDEIGSLPEDDGSALPTPSTDDVVIVPTDDEGGEECGHELGVPEDTRQPLGTQHFYDFSS